MAIFKPSVDLQDLPKKLTHATEDERRRLLQGLHERMWHAPAADMLRMLQAMLLPKDVLSLGVQVANECPQCREWKPRIHKSAIKSSLSTQFNEVVETDLFFLWDKTFMLLIDECIRWKTGDEIPSKQPHDLLRALVYLWIRIWGPMQTLMSDQEGGFVSNEATAFFDLSLIHI